MDGVYFYDVGWSVWKEHMKLRLRMMERLTGWSTVWRDSRLQPMWGWWMSLKGDKESNRDHIVEADLT